MIAVTAWIDRIRIDDRHNTFLLVPFDLACLNTDHIGRRNKDRHRNQHDDDVTDLDRRKKHHRGEDREICDRLAGVRLKHDQTDGAREYRSAYQHLAEGELAGPPAAEIFCEHQDGRYLYELGRL